MHWRLKSPDDGAHSEKRADNQQVRADAMFLSDQGHFKPAEVGMRRCPRTVLSLSRLVPCHNGGSGVGVARDSG